jgi:hypothetical protein
VTRQRILFPEPDPDRLDPDIEYSTLEDDEPPFGPLMYLQELHASLKQVRGAEYASIKCREAWARYCREGGQCET